MKSTRPPNFKDGIKDTSLIGLALYNSETKTGKQCSDQVLLGVESQTSSKRSASFVDSASETTAGGGGPINNSLSSPN